MAATPPASKPPQPVLFNGPKTEVSEKLRESGGLVVGIEAKASSTVTEADFRHLSWLRDRLGDRFAGGYVLYLGHEGGSFGDRLAALPLSEMWRHRRLPAPAGDASPP